MRASKVRRIRNRRALIAVVAIVVLHAVAGFWIVPAVVKAQGEKRLSAALGRTVTIARVAFNPYTLALTIESFDVRERDGVTEFAGWDRLRVDFETLSFLTGEWHFREVSLAAPRARIVANKDGSLNFSDLLAGATAAAAPAPPAAEAAGAAAMKPLRIDRLTLADARLDFSDEGRAQPFATRLGPVGFAVTNFVTVGGNHAPYHFEAATESGEKLTWTGWIQATPFESKGELTLSGLVLKKYAPYYAERTGLDLVDGRLTVRGRYEISLADSRRALKLIEGALELRDLKLLERNGGAPVLDLPAADIAGATADGLTLGATVAKVELRGGQLRLRREADGSINLLTLLQPAGTATAAAVAPTVPATPGPAQPAPTSAPAGTPGPAPTLAVGEVALRDWQVYLEDRTLATPALLELAGVSVSLKDFSLATGATMPVELGLGWKPTGSLRVQGTLSLQPMVADLQVELDSLELGPLSGYLEQQLAARIGGGALSVNGRATVTLEDGAEPDVGFEGQVWLEKFALVDAARGGSLGGVSDLVINGLKVATAPRLTLSAAEVNVTRPQADVVIGADGALNLAGLVRPTAAAAPGPDAPQTAAPPAVAGLPATPAGPRLEVGRVVIVDGQFRFVDQSLKPQVQMALAGFGGSLSGLATDAAAPAAFDLAAKVNDRAPFTVKGSLGLAGPAPAADVALALRDADLRSLSAYSGKFAGFELARGRMTVDVAAKLADRQLQMENKVVLDDFTFGKAVASPDATKLPVRLGVALLKDASGQIVLDVPVRGSLDDPEFKVGRVVLRVIVNLLTKVATSPFALLGAVVGAADNDLNEQPFRPGSAEIEPETAGRLDALVKALVARPGLNLEIAGGFDAAADARALRERKLGALVRQAHWEERSKTDPNPPPVDLPLTDAEFAATVKLIFDRQFPPGSESGTPLPPAPPVLAPPEREPAGWFRRIVDFVTMRGSRERAAFEREQKRVQEEYLARAKEAVDTGLPLETMTARLLETFTVEPGELADLAAARASAVHGYLVNKGGIAASRLELRGPATAGDTGAGQGARVVLELR